MNLTSLFNLKFLKENMKRSKAIILLLIFLIPVINVIIYLMSAVNSGTLMPTLMELSPLSTVGMYIMPVILSITLFSFIYKRKSSDFVMSFPVSKKQIFISNTIGGIAVIIAMNLVNYLFTLIATLLMPNILVDYRMLFDLFILWTVSYIFVFTCTNIAVSVASNKITTIAVTLLVLFLVPFTHTFITSDEFKGTNSSSISTYCASDACRPQNYECYNTSCEINKRNNLYVDTNYHEIEENTNYTIPYTLIYSTLLGGTPSNINSSILKMFFLSIVYIIIGLLLFMKKKFEVVETSFKSERLHIFVRSLTTVPILCIYYILLTNSRISLTVSDLFTMIFLFVLILTYIIIYDLLTRKKVTNIFKSLAALIIVGIVVIFTGEISSQKIEYIDVGDIKRMSFNEINLSSTGGCTDNKDIINYIMSIHMDNTSNGNFYKPMTINIKVDNKTYEFNISVTEEQYDYILDALSKDETYQKTSEEIKEKDVFAIQLNGDSSFISKDLELYTKIIDKFKETKIVKNNNPNNLLTVSIYIYDNFNNDEIFFSIEADTPLAEEILNYYNTETKKAFENPEIGISSYFIGKLDTDNTVTEEYYSSYTYDYTEIDKFILDNVGREKIDITKPYMYIKIYTYGTNNNSYIFITNKVDELQKLISEIEIKEETDTGDTDGKYTY